MKKKQVKVADLYLDADLIKSFIKQINDDINAFCKKHSITKAERDDMGLYRVGLRR